MFEYSANAITKQWENTYYHSVEIINMGYLENSNLLVSFDGSGVVQFWDPETG